MSFLPYASANPASWVSAISLSTAAHGALVAAFVMGAVPLLPPRVDPSTDEQDFLVSLEILDAEIIQEFSPVTDAALPLTETDTIDDVLPEAEADELTALTPDTPELAPEPELIPDLAEPEELPEADVLEPEEVLPEPEIATPEPEPSSPDLYAYSPASESDPESLLVDDLSPVEDSVISPLAEGGSAPVLVPEFLDEPATQQPVFPDDPQLETDIVTLPEPDTLLPEEVAPQDDTIALLAPEDTPLDAPLLLDEPTAEPELLPEPEPAPDAPETEAGTQEPDEDPVDALLPVPGAPAAGSVIENPTPQDVALGRLLQRIRTLPAPQCTLALPRRAGNGEVGLSLIGADGLVLTQFANRVLDRTGLDVQQARELVDARQCAVLDALAQSGSYPANRIGLSLEQTQLYSGQTLRGTIQGAGGLFITVLLIDDNGVVQDLARFTRIDGDTPIFDVPVNRTGTNPATRQLLLVLGHKDTPINLGIDITEQASTAFPLIDRDLLSATVFGIASFSVQ